MNRPPRRPTGPARRAPLRRGTVARHTEPVEPVGVTMDAKTVEHAGLGLLDQIVADFGGDAALAASAIRRITREHARLGNEVVAADPAALTASRVAIGALWHLFLRSLSPQEQIAFQGAAATAVIVAEGIAGSLALSPPTSPCDCPECAAERDAAAPRH